MLSREGLRGNAGAAFRLKIQVSETETEPETETETKTETDPGLAPVSGLGLNLSSCY